MLDIKWGIVGTNFVSDWFAEAALKTDSARLTRVYSRAMRTGRAFADKYAIKDVYDDYDAFLSGNGLDAVYIASPNALHEAQAIRALEAGKHVLCEKPAAPGIDALTRMLEAAERNGVICLEAMRPAFDPSTSVIEQNIARITPLRRAYISMCQYSSRYDRFKSGEILNAFNPSLSNAAIMDIGVYCVFMCARLFGMPNSVQAESVFLNNGMEGAGALILGYEGMQAIVNYSKINDSALPCELQGERGTIRFDRVNNPNYITLTPRGGGEEALPCAPVSDNMRYEIETFARLTRATGAAREYARVTEIQTRIIDTALKRAGIVFPPLGAR